MTLNLIECLSAAAAAAEAAATLSEGGVSMLKAGGGCPSERLLHVPHGMDGEAADQFLRLRHPGPAVVLWGALLVVFYWRAYDVLHPT